MAAFVIDHKATQHVVRLNRDLTALLVPELQTGLKKVLEQGGRDLEFDMTSTEMLDSSGIGLLIATANSLASVGGKLHLTNVNSDIFRLLKSMRLTARLSVSTRAE